MKMQRQMYVLSVVGYTQNALSGVSCGWCIVLLTKLWLPLLKIACLQLGSWYVETILFASELVSEM